MSDTNDKRPVCYLDLDGVLVDFVAGAYDFYKQKLNPLSVQYDFWKAWGMDDAEFWHPLGRTFWADLPWTAEGAELLREVVFQFGKDRIALMTSPCYTDGCIDGKMDWIRRHLPDFRRQFFVGPPKYLAAAPSKVLIDDTDANIKAFHGAGGQTVLVPRIWNEDATKVRCDGTFNVERLMGSVQAAWHNAEFSIQDE